MMHCSASSTIDDLYCVPREAAAGSTLRLTLSCILKVEMGTTLREVASKGRVDTSE
jgi:hypothetical protein